MRPRHVCRPGQANAVDGWVTTAGAATSSKLQAGPHRGQRSNKDRHRRQQGGSKGGWVGRDLCGLQHEDRALVMPATKPMSQPGASTMPAGLCLQFKGESVSNTTPACNSQHGSQRSLTGPPMPGLCPGAAVILPPAAFWPVLSPAACCLPLRAPLSGAQCLPATACLLQLVPRPCAPCLTAG